LLYVGANDVRALEFDLAAFERSVGAIAEALRASCERVAVLTLPEDLGRPSCAPKPAAANRILRGLAGVEIVELADFGGASLVLPDAVHPTSAGMVEIARRAARALGVPEPDEEIPAPGVRYRAWWGRLWVKDVVRRACERRTLQR
jgi:lysophospholipase L1-like esterase